MKRCILCASAPFSCRNNSSIFKDKLSAFTRKTDFVIAADGGLLQAQHLGLEVDLLVGDFDSVDERLISGFQKEKIIRLPREKDDTDSMFAARLIVEKGFGEVIFIGAIGGRLDHTLANLAVMNYLSFAGIKCVMIDEYCIVEILKPGKYCFDKNKYKTDTFSLQPYGGEVVGVTLGGAYYPLNNATLRMDFPVGVSNKFSKEIVEIELLKGILLIIFSNS